jgi:hypothetical protein
VTRFAPPLVLLAVTSLLLVYGNHTWSWLAGPVAAALVWAFDQKAREPSEAAPAHAPRAEPAPVD